MIIARYRKPTLMGESKSIKPGVYSMIAGVVLVGGMLYVIKHF